MQDQNSRPPELTKTGDNPILQHSVLPYGWPTYTHTCITNYRHYNKYCTMYFIRWSWLHKSLLPIYATTHVSHGTDHDHMITKLLHACDKSIRNNAEVECFISAGGWWEISLKLQLCVFSSSRWDYSGSKKWNKMKLYTDKWNGKIMVRIFILLWYISTVATMGCMLIQVTKATGMTVMYQS